MDKIMIKVSREYFVEMSQAEALLFSAKKERLIQHQIDGLQTKMAETKAHMTFVTKAVAELLNITA